MVRNLRAYFTLHVIKIKGVMCAQKKLNFLVYHKNEGKAQSIFQEISPLLQRKISKIDCKNNFSGVAESWRPTIQGWHLLPPSRPMATALCIAFATIDVRLSN